MPKNKLPNKYKPNSDAAVHPINNFAQLNINIPPDNKFVRPNDQNPALLAPLKVNNFVEKKMNENEEIRERNEEKAAALDFENKINQAAITILTETFSNTVNFGNEEVKNEASTARNLSILVKNQSTQLIIDHLKKHHVEKKAHVSEKEIKSIADTLSNNFWKKAVTEDGVHKISAFFKNIGKSRRVFVKPKIDENGCFKKNFADDEALNNELKRQTTAALNKIIPLARK